MICLLIAAVIFPVHAESLPASSVASDKHPQLQIPEADEYAEGDRLFFKAKTKQECLVAMAKMDRMEDAEAWCKEFNGNLVLQITNQSHNVDPVDFLISIDGKRVIEKEMPYGAAHTMEMFPIQVPLGKHIILVESKNGQAKKRLTITVKDRLYVAISYSYNTKKDFYGPSKRQFKIETSKRRFVMR